MDPDDALPPAIRRSSREALKLKSPVQHNWADEDDSDETVPPPISRQRSTSLGASTKTKGDTGFHTPPVPNKSPLRTRPTTAPDQSLSPSRSRNFSHPFKELLLQNATLASQPQQLTSRAQPTGPRPTSSRKLPRPSSQRHNSRLPPRLKRWSSLETIDSVTTAPSIQTETPRQSVDSSSTGFSTLDEEGSIHQSNLSAPPSSSVASSTSSSLSKPLPKPIGERSTSVSLLNKFKSKKFKEPLVEPEHLEIERTVSVDQVSHRTSSSSSLTISSGRPSELGYTPSRTTSYRSQDSTDWKSSDYDISGLSESDLKKCKKKGINPALYAEMKAARRGKFISPIGGNAVI